MSDFYLENPGALEGQPKRAIADYVERNGILVPRRFSSLDEALASDDTFIMRSEHIHEYGGASGLLESHVIKWKRIRKAKKEITEFPENPHPEPSGLVSNVGWEHYERSKILAPIDEVPQKVTEARFKENSRELAEVYCNYLGLDVDKFMSGITFSYWKLLDGFNRTIVADNAIEGRYHLITSRDKPIFNNYSIIHNGNVQNNGPNELTTELLADLENVMKFYEKIRHLGRFNPGHCPIVEFQTIGNEHFFLQYKRTRDSSPSTFRLDRDLEDGEAKAELVRGATPQEGMVLQTAIWYPNFEITEHEDASFDAHPDFVFTEIMSKRRKAQFISQSLKMFSIATYDTGGHSQISKLFNPVVSALVEISDIFAQEEIEEITENVFKHNVMVRIPIRLVSDGETAYIKRMD